MSGDRPYVEENARELERMRALVNGLGDDELRRQVAGEWSVADVLGHIAFWDARALFLANKLERGEPFSTDDDEPDDVDWINDAAHPLIHAIPPRDAAMVALRLAEETDERVAALPPERMYPGDETSPLNAVRASHRGEHLDQIEAALGSDGRSAP